MKFWASLIGYQLVWFAAVISAKFCHFVGVAAVDGCDFNSGNSAGGAGMSFRDVAAAN